MAEKDSSKEIERIYVVPLRRAKIGRASRAAPRAVKQVRGYLNRHMKVDKEDIWIDDSLNRELWSQGKYRIPSKIRVRAVKFEDGVVEVTLPEIGVKKSRREILKEEKEKKVPILRKEEEVPEGEGVPGAGDYEISPTVDGEVKIKRKKAPKEEKIEKKKETKKKPAKKVEKKKTTKETRKRGKKKTEKKPKAPKKGGKTRVKKKTTPKRGEKK
ncbi:MAG: 50S ribosomal protein L31e [Thermoplasmatales archaeon]|nr:MAG: 50S ribosomal protein L31e [Thermoplasmatales archaeon]